jgi:hypothetical protein
MHGSWAKTPRRNRSRRAAALLIAVGLVGAAAAGCVPGQKFPGTLAPGYSRLSVMNKTPWNCEVAIEPAQAGLTPTPTDLRARIGPDKEYTWDLIPGRYKLSATKLDPPVTGFTEMYDADAGKDRQWPLLDVLGRSR